jgi:hypothetical protein
MPNDLETRVRDLERLCSVQGRFIEKLTIGFRGHQRALEAILGLLEADQQQQQPAQGAPLSTLN